VTYGWPGIIRFPRPRQIPGIEFKKSREILQFFESQDSISLASQIVIHGCLEMEVSNPSHPFVPHPRCVSE
jgi:hypothetical protein